MRLLVHALSSVLSCVAVCGLYSQDCGQSIYEKVTDDFSFTASSDKGAVGDVIAIDISLTVENFPIDDVFSGFGIAGCYDDNIMELVAGPQYSIAFDEISAFSTFHHDRVKRNGQKCGGCFVLGSAFGNAEVGEKTVVVGQAFQVGTLFFRLKGKAGDTSKIEFCDNALRVGENDGCDNNLLYYYSKTPSGDLTKDLLYALSTRHQPGVI